MSVFSARFGIGRFDQSRFDTLEGELSSKPEIIIEKKEIKVLNTIPETISLNEKPFLKIIRE